MGNNKNSKQNKNHVKIIWLSEDRLPKGCSKEDKRSCEKRINWNKERGRSPFLHDLGTIQHLIDFRKLSRLTQVHLDPDHRVRSRLTHSLEVANIAIQMARYFTDQLFEGEKNSSRYSKKELFEVSQKIEDVTRAACLIHDIGHPPFAHASEGYLKDSKQIKRVFDSNINNLRILGGLSPRTRNIDLTLTIIDASLKKKHSDPFLGHGFCASEVELISTIGRHTGTSMSLDAIEKMAIPKCFKEKVLNYKCGGELHVRHPITYMMEAADDISYIAADVEDAILKGIVTVDQVVRSLSNAGCKKLLSSSGGWESVEKSLKKPNKLKAALIRTMLEHVKDVMNDIAMKVLEERRQDLLERVNALPYTFLGYCLCQSGKAQQSEFGNLLYMGRGDRFYKFKKDIQSRIFSSYQIVESNSFAVQTVSTIIKYLLARKDRLAEVAGFLKPYGSEWSEELYILASDESKPKNYDEYVENLLLDFISSLTDAEANEFAQLLGRSYFFREAK